MVRFRLCIYLLDTILVKFSIPDDGQQIFLGIGEPIQIRERVPFLQEKIGNLSTRKDLPHGREGATECGFPSRMEAVRPFFMVARLNGCKENSAHASSCDDACDGQTLSGKRIYQQVKRRRRPNPARPASHPRLTGSGTVAVASRRPEITVVSPPGLMSS
jgi:hypothetical protein